MILWSRTIAIRNTHLLFMRWRCHPQGGVPCSIIARMWRRCLPSAAPGMRPSLESVSTAPDMETTGTSGAASSLLGVVRRGFERVAHLRQAALPGGDAAARYPVQAAAGFLAQLDELPDLTAAPFKFGPRYQGALELVRRGVRTFSTTSMGRLFDAAAALLGFVRETTYEGQAAIWVEQLAGQAGRASDVDAYPFPFTNHELDFRPLLESVVSDRIRGRPIHEIARAFQRGIAEGLFSAVRAVSSEHGLRTVVLSGGVFQNELLLDDCKAAARWRRFSGMDQPYGASKRWRHQPRPGGAGCVRD